MNEIVTLKCEFCGQPHSYKLDIAYKEIVFGGPSKFDFPISLTCPTTNKEIKYVFKSKHSVSKINATLINDKIHEQPKKNINEISKQTSQISNEDLVFEDVKNLFLNSRNNIKDYSFKMIQVSLTLIGAYVGLFKISNLTFKMIHLLPVALITICIVLFYLVYSPKLDEIDIQNYEECKNFRKNYFTKRNKLKNIASLIFLLALISTILILFINF